MREISSIFARAAMNILIVKLGSIGDIVHALPVVSHIKNCVPDARISWAVERSSAEILRGNDQIEHLIEIDTRKLRDRRLGYRSLTGFGSSIRSLRKHRFDIALDLQGLLKSVAVAKLSGARIRYGFAKSSLREPASRFLLTDTYEVPDNVHVIRKNLLLAAKALSLPAPAGPPVFSIATLDVHRKEADQIIRETGPNFAILNPAGGWPTKLWPARNFGILADMLWERFGLQSIVTIGPRESALAEDAAGAASKKHPVIARPSLKGFYELARRAKIYVGGDTGPTHIAAAAGAPIVGIFGPTEWWRNGSLDPLDICVGREDISCRIDCHRRSCSNWICMDIAPETVLAAVEKRLSETIAG